MMNLGKSICFWQFDMQCSCHGIMTTCSGVEAKQIIGKI